MHVPRKIMQLRSEITDSGLYFAKNRPETHFLRDFTIIWLSVELAGRAKIWGSHPQFRYWTSFFSDEYASETNISLDFTFPGFTLLENDQKCTFYVILWVNGLLGGPCRVLWGSQPKFCTWPSRFTWILRCKEILPYNHHLWPLLCYKPSRNALFTCFNVNLAMF